MFNIPLGRSDYFREVAKEARIRCVNRYYEANPLLTEDQVALLARPGMRRFIYVGEGPIRAIYSQPGAFTDDVFVASGEELYRVDKFGDPTLIFDGLIIGGSVTMVATGNIGETPEFLFFADGSSLYVYVAEGFASDDLEATGAIANADVVSIGGVYYQWTNASVDAGTPAGTVGNPWLVALGANNTQALANMFNAINATGTPGVTYSTALEENEFATAYFVSSTHLRVRAKASGTAGNTIAVTETGANLVWSSPTFAGGGTPTVTQVPTPDDVGIVSLGYIASYVIAVPAQGFGINGRFFWIEPGETTIDALNFATAERAPDPVNDVIVFNDQFWLPGQDTTEVWYMTGNIDAPALRLQGVVFDHGTWAGTAVRVEESMIIVSNTGAVYQIGGGLKRISRPDIEEQIRDAMWYQAAQA